MISPIDYESIEIFNKLRTDLVASLTLIAELPEGDLYYFEDLDRAVFWLVVGPQTAIVAYRTNEQDLPVIKERVRIWHDALKNRVSEPPDVGMPVYAAEVETETGDFFPVWVQGGDWIYYVFDPPSKNYTVLPVGWPESYRDRIKELALKRLQMESLN